MGKEGTREQQLRELREQRVTESRRMRGQLNKIANGLADFAEALPPKPAASVSAKKIPAADFDRPVVYRGIKIDPPRGKRSPVARAVRDELRKQAVAPSKYDCPVCAARREAKRLAQAKWRKKAAPPP